MLPNPQYQRASKSLDTSLDTMQVGQSLAEFPDQIEQVIQEMASQDIPAACHLVDNIVVSGMGGSALGGRIISSLERETLRIPLVISTEFHLPNFVGPKTLVVISSYSGNTEETLASLSEAISRNAQIFVMASGGRLAEAAKTHHLPSYIFNPRHNVSGQPRMALGYCTVSFLSLLVRCGLVNPMHELGGLPDYLRSRLSQARSLESVARHMVDRIPVLVGSEHFKGALHGFKNQLNENAKSFAVAFDLPELNHHLLEGLRFPSANPDNLFFLFCKSSKYHPEILKRYPVTEQVVAKQSIPFYQLDFHAPSRLYETFELIQAGGHIAYYLSLLQGIDPGPIPWVDWYKDEISKL